MTASRSDRIAALAGRTEAAPPLVMVTAYDFASARIVDTAGVDLVLVGDSAAMSVLGYATTRDISVNELLVLTRAARRGTRSALLVGDLPFGTYEHSDEQAVATGKRFADAGCDVVKMEGAGPILSRVRAVVAAGIPVMGHVGLLPQSATTAAGLRARGRTAPQAIQIVEDGIALQEAGCCALVVEAVPAAVARAIADRVSIPVIGIGAGASVDGQVLVFHDLLGLGDNRVPRFVRPYAELRYAAIDAVRAFAADVRKRVFPVEAEEYGMPVEEAEAFEEAVRLGFRRCC